jgi:putative FmdB family regulatory protein
MPVYEYLCLGCKDHFEKLVAITGRDEAIDCPRCGMQGAERLLSTFAAFASDGGQTRAVGGCCGGACGCAG